MYRFAAAAVLLSAPGLAAAQDCASYAQFKAGTVLTQQSLDAKGKPQGLTTAKTTAVKPVDGGLEATVHAETVDSKGKVSNVLDYSASCLAGAVRVDMRAFLASDTMSAYKDWDVKIDADHVDYPAALAAGLALPDGHVKMTMAMRGATPGMPGSGGSMTLDLVNRAVVGPERVTVPAGAFDAWKISYDANTTLMTVAPFKISLHVTEWWVPGLGAVRSETTSAKGNPMGSSQLTAVAP